MKTADPSPAELAVLEQLWRHGERTTRELVEALYPPGGPSEYATVQKLLERLEIKGLVSRDARLRSHRFKATVQRDLLIGRRLENLAKELCGGSFAPLVAHLVTARKLSKKEREQLRALMKEISGISRPGKEGA